jgi:hypothetical protein
MFQPPNSSLFQRCPHISPGSGLPGPHRHQPADQLPPPDLAGAKRVQELEQLVSVCGVFMVTYEVFLDTLTNNHHHHHRFLIPLCGVGKTCFLLPFFSITLTNNIHTIILSYYLIVIWVPTYLYDHTFIHTYHSRFIPKGVAEASQIFLRNNHVLPKLLSYASYIVKKQSRFPLSVLIIR